MTDAAGSGRQVAGSEPVRIGARIGLVAYGITHLLIAWLALQVAFGAGGGRTDQTGAFQTIADEPFGRVLLWVLVVGFVAVALWRLGQAVFGFSYVEDTKDQVKRRVESGARAAVFAALAVLAASTALGDASGNGGREAAAGVLGWPGGRFLVGLAGLAVLAIGAVKVKHGWEKKFTEDMDLPSDRHAREVAVRTGQVGSVAKGIAIGLIGVLVIVAAVQFDPGKANGLDPALKMLAGEPFGMVMLGAVALGLAAYGVFCFFDARYHRVSAPGGGRLHRRADKRATSRAETGRRPRRGTDSHAM
jgi:hypothetical protein